MKTIGLSMAVALAATSGFAQSVKGAESLTLRQQNIVAVASLTAKGDLQNLKKSVEESLDSGLTVNEIGELMLQAYAYCGFPKSLNAQNVLSSVLKEREAKGIKDNYGTKPAAVSDTNRYDIGRETINKIFDGNATQSRPTDTGYSATTDVFLKEHLFADIIERDNMGYKDRELATVGFLSGLMTVNPQLMAHINGALTIGNSEEQLKAAVKVISVKVGKAEGKNAEKVLSQVLENRKNSKANSVANNSAQTKKTDENGNPVTALQNPVAPAEAKVSAFDVGNYNANFAKYFTGESYLSVLNTEGMFVANVTFEPGCRNNWHIHHAKTGGGQLLIAVGGRGYYQLEGQEPVEMKAGDVALMPANVKHWHGAAKDSWFSHIALEIPGTESSTEWLEKVSDADYAKLK